MSAFGSPWGEIDETRPGVPVVVDSNGWGWFGLLFLLALPLMVIGGVSRQVCAWIEEHLVIFVILYVASFIVLGLVLYARPNARHRIFGVVATVLTAVPLGLVLVLYFVPYALSRDSVFEVATSCLSTVGLLGAVMFLILSVGALLRNGARHFAIAFAFSAIGIAISFVSMFYGSALVSFESFNSFYGL